MKKILYAAALAAALALPAAANSPQIKAEFDAAKKSLDSGANEQAISAFTALIDSGKAKDEWLAYSHFYRAVALRRTEQEGKALADLRQTLKLAPDLGPAHVQLGLIFHEQKKFGDAVQEYDTAIKLEPNNPELYYLRCVSKSLANDNRGARADCGRAVELKPDYVEALAGLGRAHEDLGDKAKALETYQQVLKLDPDNKAAQDGIKFIQETQG